MSCLTRVISGPHGEEKARPVRLIETRRGWVGGQPGVEPAEQQERNCQAEKKNDAAQQDRRRQKRLEESVSGRAVQLGLPGACFCARRGERSGAASRLCCFR